MAGLESVVSIKAANSITTSVVLLSVLSSIDATQATLFVMLIWRIWKTGNDILWEGKFSSAAQVLSVANS